MTEWQEIDSAPKDGRWFLACDPHSQHAYRARWDGSTYIPEGAEIQIKMHHGANYWAPVLWAPLLDPPWMVPEKPEFVGDGELPAEKPK